MAEEMVDETMDEDEDYELSFKTHWQSGSVDRTDAALSDKDAAEARAERILNWHQTTLGSL